MHHLDHSHAHRPAADDHRGRYNELHDIVAAHNSEGFTPPGYALRELAALEALLGVGEEPLD